MDDTQIKVDDDVEYVLHTPKTILHPTDCYLAIDGKEIPLEAFIRSLEGLFARVEELEKDDDSYCSGCGGLYPKNPDKG